VNATFYRIMDGDGEKVTFLNTKRITHITLSCKEAPYKVSIYLDSGSELNIISKTEKDLLEFIEDIKIHMDKG